MGVVKSGRAVLVCGLVYKDSPSNATMITELGLVYHDHSSTQTSKTVFKRLPYLV